MAALWSARKALEAISPTDLVEYVEAWQEDRARWREWILDRPRLDGIDSALHDLGLGARTERSEPYDEPAVARERSTRSLRDAARSQRACGE
jgi:hypothetical protein